MSAYSENPASTLAAFGSNAALQQGRLTWAELAGWFPTPINAPDVQNEAVQEMIQRATQPDLLRDR